MKFLQGWTFFPKTIETMNGPAKQLFIQDNVNNIHDTNTQKYLQVRFLEYPFGKYIYVYVKSSNQYITAYWQLKWPKTAIIRSEKKQRKSSSSMNDTIKEGEWFDNLVN